MDLQQRRDAVQATPGEEISAIEGDAQSTPVSFTSEGAIPAVAGTIDGRARPTASQLAFEEQQSTTERVAEAGPTKLTGTLWAKDKDGKDLPPSIEDISQGPINDCSAFAAMAGLARSHPQIIQDMIEDHGDGTYTVFFQSGEEKVTADFVKGRQGNLTARKALWPLILEKAYAQQKGGLDKLSNRNAGTAITDFAGGRVRRFKTHEKDSASLATEFAKAEVNREVTTVLAPTKENASQRQLEMTDKIPGLHLWHWYTVVGVDADGQRIQLWNPWGRDHPNGDGWMAIDDLKAFFTEVDFVR
jgi:hypothetical protein